MKIYNDSPTEDEEEKSDKEAMNEQSSLLEPSGKNDKEESRLLAQQKILLASLSGSVFALGLAVSSMINNCKILDFLNLCLIPSGTWDPSLAFVMGGGLMISAVSYQIIQGYNLVLSDDKALSSPIMCAGKDFNVPHEVFTFDRNLVLGSVAFGIGWGIGGLCPGPAVFQALVGQPQVLFLYAPSFAIGTKVAISLM